jgi:AcrR family transcriptional regulator
MARRTKTNPRKIPRQERAHFTVEAILQAAAYILTRLGWDGFTTNAVAERAGVNIASLYQYFPNKEAIVVELQRRHVEEARSKLTRALPEIARHRTLRETLSLMVQAGIAEHRVAPQLHRVFTEELPRSARVEAPNEREGEQQLLAVSQRFLRNVPDGELAAFITRVAVHAVIHEAAARRPEFLNHPEFASELVVLLQRYLQRSKGRTRPRRTPVDEPR